MLEAVLLDIDGTLVVSNDAHAKAWAEALREFGFDVPFDRIRRWIGMGGDKILPLVDSGLDDKHEPGISILEKRQQIFLHRFAPNLMATPGALELLDFLRTAGVLRVAATSAKRTEFEAITKAAGFFGEIDRATTADDADRSKPDADIVRSALAKAGADPSHALYLGDTPYDITAAHKAGVRVVALRCGGWSDDELAEADEVYDTPADLLSRPLLGLLS
ncbi:MAG: HAD family hydrolase [Candidatus Cybelea sp.]